MDSRLERLVKRLEQAEDDAQTAKKAYEKATDDRLPQAEIDRLKLRKEEAEKEVVQTKKEVVQTKGEIAQAKVEALLEEKREKEKLKAWTDADEEALKDAKAQRDRLLLSPATG